MPKGFTSYLLYLLITVLVASLYLGNFTGLQKLQWKLDDLMYSFRGEPTSSPDVVLVNIDDASMDEVGQWPWSYESIADLVATCNTGDPKTILLNLDLSPRSSEDTLGHTQILGNQISWSENIVLTYDIAKAEYSNRRMEKPKFLSKYAINTDSDLGQLEEDMTLSLRKVFLPSEIVCSYTDGLGFTYFKQSKDKKVRWVPMSAMYGGYYYPAASLLTAAMQLGYKAEDITIVGGKGIKIGNRFMETDDAGNLFVNYNNPTTTFPVYSAADILNERINLPDLAGKVIIISLNSHSGGYFYGTPVIDKMSQSEIMANVIENIIHNNHIKIIDFAGGGYLLIILGFGAFCAFTLPRVSMMYRIIILFICAFILANLNFIMFNSNSTLIKSLYLGLEIILFMLASPLLESVKTESEESTGLAGLFAMFSRGKNAEQVANANLNVPTRELKDTGQEPEYQKTEHLEAVEPGSADSESARTSVISTNQVDDADTPAEEKTSAVDYSAPPPDHQPASIISPEKKKESDEESFQVLDFNSVDAPLGGQQNDSGKIKNLGRYQVSGILGYGAMGTVYKGIDPAINRPVALKTIRLDFVTDEDEMEELKVRLFREAQAAGKLSHPNIVTIYDIGSEGNLQYIAMEYLKGQTLEEMVKKEVKFSYKIIAGIISQMCDALDYAHNMGIVHRDVKPANIMVLDDYSIKVMDFGIARVDSHSMTKTGIAMGTPNYISPELLQGKGVDRRCDLFSLGVVIYELLTGRRPFKGDSLTQLIYSIMNDNPTSPSEIDTNIPMIFDHIVDKALKKNPRERYQKAGDIKAAVADFVGSFAEAKKVNY